MRGKQEEDPQLQVLWQALLEGHNLMIRELDLSTPACGNTAVYLCLKPQASGIYLFVKLCFLGTIVKQEFLLVTVRAP